MRQIARWAFTMTWDNAPANNAVLRTHEVEYKNQRLIIRLNNCPFILVQLPANLASHY
jgi:hypothetical protein